MAPAIDDGEEEYGDGRLVDKLEYVSKVVATLQRKKKHNNSYRDGSEGLVMSALDEFVIGEYLEGVLNKHGAALNNATTVDTNVDDADLLTLVRATFPTWLSASVQRGLEDRTKLELQPWDVKTKDGPPGKDFSSALNAFMEMGLHNSIDNMLRVKIECSIDDYIQATPTTLPFQEPILESAAPNYICAVPITMSFRRILSRLKQKGSKRPDPNAPCYYRSVGAILMDIQAIEDNCRTYNSSDSVLTNSAKDIVADVKRSVTGVVISHVHELRDKLKKETDEKQILADLVGDVSPDNNADDSEPVHPFQEPWKGLLFRDWIQSWQPKQRGSISTPWVPQAGDEVYYSRELHDKFLKGHMDSLSDHQCLPLDETIWDKHPAAPKSPAEANKWVVATIISLRAEFPRVRKPSEEGAFVTEAPILALRLQFSEGDTSVIHWRPCLFLSDMSDEVDRDTECCKACSLRISKSFLRPSWEIDLDKQQGDSGTPQGLSRDELDLIERNLNFLKRRCLQQILPDKFDANLSIEQVKNGYFPSAFTVSRSTLPQFDELLKPGETEEIEAPSRLSKKKGDGPPEIDTAAVDSLAAVGFVPPWMPQFIEAASSKKVPTTPLHESISPWPNLCLELVLLRIRSGYYRHTKAVQNDIAESFLNTQLLSWAPAAKKKINPIAMKKLAKAVLSTPYTVTTNDLPFTSITQTVTAKSEVVKEAMAQVKVRVVLEDPKENQPSKGRKKVAKQKKTGPTQVSGSKRKRELAVSNPDGNEMVLIAEVPMRSVQSLGRPEATWVQCDKCKKWRRLFALVPGQKLPSRWYCSMNKNDPARAECSAPEEDYDDAANECIVADAHATSEDALSDEETLFASHAQLLRRLYSAALVGTSEPQHFSVVYGLTPLRINRQRILSTILPTTVTQADHQAAFARKQLGTLLEAIARDPCKSKLPHSVTLKIFVDGEQISAPMPDPAEADPSAPTKAPSKTGDNSIKFGKRNLKVNNKLTRTLLKPSRGFPCVRCQAARKGLYTCRGMYN